MPIRLGPTELIIILVIVLLLFGVGRIGKIAGELGSGIRAFKDGIQGDKKEETTETKVEENKPKGE
jgi:sec-independent protein translocase protein TatA